MTDTHDNFFGSSNKTVNLGCKYGQVLRLSIPSFHGSNNFVELRVYHI